MRKSLFTEEALRRAKNGDALMLVELSHPGTTTTEVTYAMTLNAKQRLSVLNFINRLISSRRK